MDFGIAFAPLVPQPVLWAAIAIAVLFAVLLLIARSRGALARAAALALLVLALANPSFTREDREPLSSVAVVVIDKSPSQSFGERGKQTEAARAQLAERLGRIQGLEVRFVEAGEADGETDGTRLFGALEAALADVPPDRVAGAMFITDGRVHDIPTDAKALGFNAPIHALVTGHEGERDRRVVLEAAPRFAIVGQTQTISFRIEDQGIAGAPADIVIRRDGEIHERRTVTPGTTVQTEVHIPHAGQNIVEIEASTVDGELTPVNNRAVVTIEGVRDTLRVLLVSGVPHAGERTWRNLLKSDASVDLVHFTILRPPDKQDGTPIHELSLIAFPTRELFQQKIDEFDLIIFDRYARQGVLPMIYYDNIARYVRDGGAVLIAAGPDYAGQASLWNTPLDQILPAEPSGMTIQKPFHASLTDLGARHPVTRALEGSESSPPRWSRWFRVIDTVKVDGTPVMSGADGKPLLVLAREGEGRVGLLLSDHIWLWARGYQGGGPHLDLMRRLSHWLMKQPDLEEEALRLISRGRDLIVERQTMAEAVSEVTLTLPSGTERKVALKEAEPGLWRAQVEASELGLWRATDGELTALVNIGPANPLEFAQVTSSPGPLATLTDTTGGAARRIAASAEADISLPRIIGMRSGEIFHGSDWAGLRLRDASVVRGIGVLPVFAGLLGLLLLIGSLALMWAREGR